MLITKEMEWVSNWMQENNVSGEPEMIPKKFSSVGHLLLAIITDYSKLHQPTVISAGCENPHCYDGIVIAMFGENYRCGICEDKQTDL